MLVSCPNKKGKESQASEASEREPGEGARRVEVEVERGIEERPAFLRSITVLDELQVREVAGAAQAGAGTYHPSQLSHFSSCLIVFVLSSPQAALLDVAHWAFSTSWWPQP